MKKTMMYLPDDLHRYLATQAEVRGSSMAEIAREAISEYRTRHAAEKSASVASVFGVLTDSDPSTDLASGVDSGLDEYYAAGGAWEQEHGRACSD